MRPVKQAMLDTTLPANGSDEVILGGGSTRVPAVQALVRSSDLSDVGRIQWLRTEPGVNLRGDRSDPRPARPHRKHRNRFPHRQSRVMDIDRLIRKARTR